MKIPNSRNSIVSPIHKLFVDIHPIKPKAFGCGIVVAIFYYCMCWYIASHLSGYFYRPAHSSTIQQMWTLIWVGIFVFPLIVRCYNSNELTRRRDPHWLEYMAIKAYYYPDTAGDSNGEGIYDNFSAGFGITCLIFLLVHTILIVIRTTSLLIGKH